MRALIRWLFHTVTYACTHCAARQRIPLRRVHFFERFHDLVHGEVVLIACPQCREGLQIPTPYRSHTGHPVHFDPDDPSKHVLHVSSRMGPFWAPVTCGYALSCGQSDLI